MPQQPTAQPTSQPAAQLELAVGDTLEITISRMAHGGEGIGEAADGRVVFVAGGLPGDRLIATLTQVKKRFARAELKEITSPGDYRVAARCPAASAGAGCCDFNHLDPAKELSLKTEILQGQLSRIKGHETLPKITARSLKPNSGWRTRTRLGIDANGRAGIRKLRSNDLITEVACSQNLPGLLDGIVGPGSKTFRPGAELIVVRDDAGERHVVETRKASRGRRSETIHKVVEGSGEVVERVSGQEFRFPATAFWQAHTAAPQRYSEIVKTWLSELLTKAKRSENIQDLPKLPVAWDLYGGVGLFSSAIGQALENSGYTNIKQGAVVHSVDYSPAAKKSDRELSAKAKTATVEVHSGMVEKLVDQLPSPVAVVLDPPRTGAGEQVVKAVAAAKPLAVVHIGCDAATLSRDLQSWLDSGYQVQRIELIDAFPGTHHYEIITALVPAHT